MTVSGIPNLSACVGQVIINDATARQEYEYQLTDLFLLNGIERDKDLIPVDYDDPVSRKKSFYFCLDRGADAKKYKRMREVQKLQNSPIGDHLGFLEPKEATYGIASHAMPFLDTVSDVLLYTAAVTFSLSNGAVWLSLLEGYETLTGSYLKIPFRLTRTGLKKWGRIGMIFSLGFFAASFLFSANKSELYSVK